MCFCTLGVTAQTMKYKEIYSLIKTGKKVEALPHLLTFLKEEPKHANGNYWAGKIYYENAQRNNSSQQADSSIMFFKQALVNISVLDVNILNASRFPDFTGTDATIVLENGKKWMQGKIEEIESIKKSITQNNINADQLKSTEEQKAKNEKVKEEKKLKQKTNEEKALDDKIAIALAEKSKKDSTSNKFLLMQPSFKSRNKCPDCAESGARYYYNEMIAKLQEEGKTNSKNKEKILTSIKFCQDILKENKFSLFYLSNTKAIVEENVLNGRSSGQIIYVGKVNNKWIGLSHKDEGYEKIGPTGEEWEHFSFWRSKEYQKNKK